MIVELSTTNIEIIPELNAVNLVITPTFTSGGGSGSDSNIISVKDFGAKGDGVWDRATETLVSGTDDTFAIQAAINAAQEVHGICFFPVGRYKITDTLNINKVVFIRGESSQGSMIHFVTPNTLENLQKPAILIQRFESYAYEFDGGGISDLYIYCNRNSDGIRIDLLSKDYPPSLPDYPNGYHVDWGMQGAVYERIIIDSPIIGFKGTSQGGNVLYQCKIANIIIRQWVGKYGFYFTGGCYNEFSSLAVDVVQAGALGFYISNTDSTMRKLVTDGPSDFRGVNLTLDNYACECTPDSFTAGNALYLDGSVTATRLFFYRLKSTTESVIALGSSGKINLSGVEIYQQTYAVPLYPIAIYGGSGIIENVYFVNESEFPIVYNKLENYTQADKLEKYKFINCSSITDISNLGSNIIATLPTPTEKLRFSQLTIKGLNGEKDSLFVCLKNNDGIYEWVDNSVGTGGVSKAYVDQQDLLKVDKVTGKGLSTNDFTDILETKLNGIEEGAQVNAAGTVVDVDYVHTDNNYTDAAVLEVAKIADKMDLDGINSDIDKIHFGTNATTPTAQDLYWDNAEGTLGLHLADGGDIQLGKEMFEYYQNIDTVPMVAGDVVSLVAISGNRKGIKLTDATNESLSRNVVGMVTVPTIAVNGIGRVTILGNVHELNTNAYTEGESIYVSGTTKGKWVQTPPAAPAYNIKIGTIEVKHQTVGIVALSTITYPKLSDLSDVDGTPLTVSGQVPVWDAVRGVFDFTDNIKPLTTLTDKAKQLTGFEFPQDIIVDWNNTNANKITLTATAGKLTAYWKGLPISGLTATDTSWTSLAIVPVIGNKYYLYSTDGVTISWSTTAWTFDQLMVAMIYYNGSAWVAVREVHGLMDRYTHEQLHNAMGTTLRSGGDISGLVVNSAIAINRRPSISQFVLADEDLLSTMDLVNGNYSQFILTGANSNTVTTGATEIVPVLAANPYYVNTLTYQQILFANNNYGKIFILAQPTANDATSKANRLLFIQPQQVSNTLATIQAITTANLNLNGFGALLNEFVFIGEIIIRYTAADWVITSFAKITGNKQLNATVGGGALTSVTTDSTLTGGGTAASPLSVVGMVQSVSNAVSGTIAILPNTVTVFATAFTTAGGSVAFEPTPPTDVLNYKESTISFSIGADLPANVTISKAGVTFQFMGKAQPTWGINKKYTFVFFWESTTLCQVYYEIKI